MTVITVSDLGGQFVLSAHTPQSASPLRSVASLWGNRFYHGRRFRNKINFSFPIFD